MLAKRTAPQFLVLLMIMGGVFFKSSFAIAGPITSSIEKIDASFSELGFEVKFCHLQRVHTSSLILERGAGECLWEQLKQTLLNKDVEFLPIEIWAQSYKAGDRGPVLPIYVSWRPTQEGLWGLMKEFGALSSESFHQIINKIMTRNKDQELPLSFKQSLIGEIHITFPKGLSLQNFTTKKSDYLKFMGPIENLSFGIKPLYRKNASIYYGLSLIVNETNQVQAKTNINILKLSRPFTIDGRGELQP